MSEQFISAREEKIQKTVDTMREAIPNRTPEEIAVLLDTGLDMMREDQKENSAFYARMKGVTALRTTAQRQHSDEVYANARQLYGPLGYDASPRKIRKI